MLKTLTLIRHTKPDISPGICYGQTDIGVADSFAAEAEAITEWLSPPELIITSPLLRTRCLAEFLASKYSCELRTHAGLMEINFGGWEGRAWNDIARGEIEAWSADILHYTPPHGESAQQLIMRVHKLQQDLALLPQQHIAIVAHGGSMRALLAHAASIPLVHTLNWQIDYGAVISLRHKI